MFDEYIKTVIFGTASTGKFTLPSNLAFVAEYTKTVVIGTLVLESLHCHQILHLMNIQRLVIGTAGAEKLTLQSNLAFV